MKSFLILLISLLMSSTSFAKPKMPSLELCMRSEDSLDREYCQKKRMRFMNKNFSQKFKFWESSIKRDQKNAALREINKTLSEKSEMIKLLQAEENLLKTQLAKVNGLKSVEDKNDEHNNSRRNKRREKKRKIKKFFKKIF